MTSTTKETMPLTNEKVLVKATAPQRMTHGGGIVKVLHGVGSASRTAATNMHLNEELLSVIVINLYDFPGD
jgi:hypothetical protein